jgi:hypothetical protein
MKMKSAEKRGFCRRCSSACLSIIDIAAGATTGGMGCHSIMSKQDL